MRPSTSKKMTTHFTAVVCDQSHNASEICLCMYWKEVWREGGEGEGVKEGERKGGREKSEKGLKRKKHGLRQSFFKKSYYFHNQLCHLVAGVRLWLCSFISLSLNSPPATWM